MSLNKLLPAALLCLILGAGVTAPAAAAPTGPSAADIAAMQNYTLTEGFLEKWKAIQKDGLKDPCNLSLISLMKDESAPQSLDKTAAKYDAQPGVHAMLASHDITARDYLLGSTTLLAAGFQQMAIEHPEMVTKGYIKPQPWKVSAASMSVYRAHKDEIHQFMQTLGRQALKDNGGNLPSCDG